MRSRAWSGPAARRSPRCDASCPRCAATTGRRQSSRRSPASTASTHCWTRSAAPGSPSSCTSTVSRSRFHAAIDLSAYRIVQEGLTNALKHAHASDADVIVRYRPDELEIEVRDNGQGSATSDGLGHGLVGVRERVKIYGGEMSAGTSAEGGFVLSTRLPVGGEGP